MLTVLLSCYCILLCSSQMPAVLSVAVLALCCQGVSPENARAIRDTRGMSACECLTSCSRVARRVCATLVLAVGVCLAVPLLDAGSGCRRLVDLLNVFE